MSIDELMPKDVDSQNKHYHQINGLTVNSKDRLFEALQRFKELLGHYPTSSEWNENKDEANVNTRASHIKRNTGMGLAEAKDELGADKSRYQPSGKSYKITEEMKKPSAEKAYLIGVILGDASVGQYHGDWKFTMQTKDREFAKGVADNLEKWISEEEVTVKVRGPMNRDDNSEPVWQISKGGKEIFKELNEIQNLDADEILKEFNKYIKHLLRGLWDSEGSVDKRGKIMFTNTDIKVMRLYLNTLINVLNIKTDSEWKWASYKRSGQRLGHIYIRVDNENVITTSIPKRYNKEFLNKINPTIERKMKRLNKTKEVKQTHQIDTKTMQKDNSSTNWEFEEIINEIKEESL